MKKWNSRIDRIGQNGGDGEHYTMSRDKESNYYDQGGIETLDVIKAKLTEEQYEGYLLGNSIKYTLRANWKDNRLRDLEKASNYIKWFIELLEEEN